MKPYILFCSLLLVSPAVGLAEEASGRFDAAGLEEPEVRAFFNALQEGVRSGRPDRVVDLVEFPLPVNDCKGTRSIQRKDFNRRFSSIFDAQVSRAVKEQKFETLFANWQGVMIGDGDVWFQGICEGPAEADSCSRHRIRVVTINKDCP